MYTCAGAPVVALGNEFSQRSPAKVKLNVEILFGYSRAKGVVLCCHRGRHATRVCSVRSCLAPKYFAQHGQRLGSIIDCGALLERGAAQLTAIGPS